VHGNGWSDTLKISLIRSTGMVVSNSLWKVADAVSKSISPSMKEWSVSFADSFI
jgi:hypothetical protein